MAKPEVVEDVEVTEVITTPVPVNQDKMDALIHAAEKIDALGKAMDKFRTFALNRALPGDWVKFKEKDSEDATIELTGAGADRIAAALGISFVEWSDSKESGTDEKGQWFTWYYTCTATWQGRRLEGVVGRAGSRDKFFGMAYGQLKAIADVNEADIRTAARRNCMKEGCKLMLGIRRIPMSSANKLGLDLSCIKEVNFGSKKSGTASSDAEAGGSVNAEVVSVTIKREVKDAPGKKGYTIYSVKAKSGAYDTFKKEKAEDAKALIGKMAAISFQVGQYGPELIDIKPFVEEKAAEASEAA